MKKIVKILENIKSECVNNSESMGEAGEVIYNMAENAMEELK